jgi:hypothetical protein
MSITREIAELREHSRRVVILIILLVSSLNVPIVKGEGLIEKYEEFEHDVIFEKVYLDLPTFESSFEKDLGSLGTVSGTAYVSLGKSTIRLPTKIKARFDTLIEPFSTNIVEMDVMPYDGEGPEFKHIFGFNLSVAYDPPGPEWLTGEGSVGDFDTGFNFEGDFTPPINNDWEATSSESFSGSIGIKKLLSFDIGLEARYKIIGDKVIGHFSEDDPYAEAEEVGPLGIVMRGGGYSEQFGIKDWDMYTSLDGYVDFEAYDLRYIIGYKIEIVNFLIGFSFAGASWTWKIPTFVTLEIPAGEDEIYVNNQESDKTAYQMSRILFPGGALNSMNDPPIFDIKTPSMVYAEPGESFQATIQLRHSVRNPPSGYSIPPTTLDVYYENEELAGSFPVTSRDFEIGEIKISLTLPTSLDPEDLYYSFRVVLQPPVIGGSYGGITVVKQREASLRVSQLRSDLNIREESLTISVPGVTFGNLGAHGSVIQRIGATVSNDGLVPSTPTTVELWMYRGMPTVPAYGNRDLIFSNAILISSQPLPPIIPGVNYSTQFLYHIPQEMSGETLTYLIEVDGGQTVPELHEENNLAFTTSEISETGNSIRWVLGSIYLGYNNLSLVYDSPASLTVSEIASGMSQETELQMDMPSFVNSQAYLANWQQSVTADLSGQAPAELVSEYSEDVNELSSTIQETIALKAYDQEHVLRILDQQLGVIGVVERIRTGTIIGQVIDDLTKQPVSGADVFAVDQTGSTSSVSTNSVGVFSLSLLKPSTYTLIVNHTGYGTSTKEVNLPPSGRVFEKISLLPAWGTLEIRVVDEITQENLEGAIVKLHLEKDVLTSVISSDGYIAISGVPTGLHQMEITKNLYESAQKVVQILPNVTESLEIELVPLNIHDTAIIGFEAVPRNLELGGTGSLALTIGNEGMWQETVNIRVYANQTLIGEETETLARQKYETFTYSWDSSGTPPGSYELMATATPVDNEIETLDNTKIFGKITVSDTEPPLVNAGQDITVSRGELVAFDASGSTDNDMITDYLWDFGDGETGTGISVSHEYVDAGTYTVSLTVLDRTGNQQTDTVRVEVEQRGFSWYWIVPVLALIIIVYFVLSKKR